MVEAPLAALEAVLGADCSAGGEAFSAFFVLLEDFLTAIHVYLLSFGISVFYTISREFTTFVSFYILPHIT
jgi:hypothetical protein